MKNFTFQWLALCLSLFTILHGLPCNAQEQLPTVGAYAVADHSPCKIQSLPGTILELDNFFNHVDFKKRFAKNFFWKDVEVQQKDWSKEYDFVPSTNTASGFNGADSSTITYIASHGITSKGIFKALSGSPNYGGCFMSSNDMSIGDQSTRYLILSTCEGLKIGNGQIPNAPGENPSTTWKKSSQGLNCIFGYSNFMADADNYGSLFIENIKSGLVPLSKAFMDASDSVSTHNIPVALCFGADENDATKYLQTNSNFDFKARSRSSSSWIYRITKPTHPILFSKIQVPNSIKISVRNRNAKKIAQMLLGHTSVSNQDYKLFASYNNSGFVTYNKETGVLNVMTKQVPGNLDKEAPNVIESEKIARKFILESRILSASDTLELAYISEDVLGGMSGIKKTVARKFIFKQLLHGLLPLSQQGSIEVTIGPSGVVTQLKSALLNLEKSSKKFMKSTDIEGRLDDIDAIAIERVATKVPGVNYKVIERKIGYDTGSFHELHPTAHAMIEVTVEANQGDFSRNYVENISL